MDVFILLVCCCKFTSPFFPVPVTPLFSLPTSLVCVCECVCIYVYMCIHIHLCIRMYMYIYMYVVFSMCVCMCVLCSQPLYGKQSLWRALAFHNQSLAPLHTPSPLPRIQTWTHTAGVSFLFSSSQPHPFLISLTAERFRSRRTSFYGVVLHISALEYLLI